MAYIHVFALHVLVPLIESYSSVHHLIDCPLFRGWLSGIAASGFQGVFGRVMVKRTLGKHG